MSSTGSSSTSSSSSSSPSGRSATALDFLGAFSALALALEIVAMINLFFGQTLNPCQVGRPERV
jgi:hypothetical protein